MRVTGTAPPLSLEAREADRLTLSIAMDAEERLEVRVANAHPHRAAIDTSSEAAVPPDSLAFSEPANQGGCAVVWLEVPFPPGLGFRPR